MFVIGVARRVVSNDFGITAIKKVILIFTGLLSTIFITRWLGAELRGEYSYVLNTVSISTTVFNLGISLVYPNFKRKYGSRVRSTFVLLTLIQFAVYLLVSVLLYLYNKDLWLFYILVLTSFGVLTLQINQILLVENIKKHSLLAIISSIANAALTVILFFFFEKNLFFALGLFLVKDAIVIVSFFYFFKIDLKKVYPRLFIETLKKGMLPMLTTMLIVVNYKIDVIMLEHLNVDFVSIGLFSVGVSLAEYAWFIPDIFKEVMLNKNAAKDSVKATAFSLRAAFTAVIVFVLLFLIAGRFILEILFGSEFVPAYIVTMAMFLAVPFMVYVKIIGTLFIGQGKWIYYFCTLSIAVILNIFFNYLLIPLYDILGAAVSSIISYSFSGLVFIFWFAKKYKIRVTDMTFLKLDDLNNIRRVLG